MTVYLIERGYFGLGENNRNKIIMKIYAIRQSKEPCKDRRSKRRRCIERVAPIDLDSLNWKELKNE